MTEKKHTDHNSTPTCDHCGLLCQSETIHQDGLYFCCTGCQTVHSLLKKQKEGSKIQYPSLERLDYLDNSEIVSTLLSFSSPTVSKVSFRLPAIHCSSCIQILEHLSNLHEGIISSRIDFPNKRVSISFRPGVISIKEIVELLVYVGYEPEINLNATDQDVAVKMDKNLILKLGSAGFIFGNVMLLSFPEYLGLNDPLFERFFGYLSLAFSIPIITYCASDYLKSAYSSILNGGLNIDVPISIGILTLFGRSAYDILTHSGSGYLDSLAGFVFLLLVGRWFQKKTYDKISFDRNYESYFPLHASRIVESRVEPTMLRNIQKGDTLLVRSGELIPCDVKLISENARLDYSFVTGEERPMEVSRDTSIYAGGRNLSSSIHVEVESPVDQSYLTRLWEEKKEHPRQEERSLMTDYVGKYFTISILLIAFGTLIYWVYMDETQVMNAFTSVLIIACPCVIALSIPFTYGTLLSLLASRSIFVKSTRTIEVLQNADTIIFDKTGTITSGRQPEVTFVGQKLSINERQLIGCLASQSGHPLSQMIVDHLALDNRDYAISHFEDIPGKGLSATINHENVTLGSANYVGATINRTHVMGPQVHVKINDRIVGYFQIETQFRPSLLRVLKNLKQRFQLYLLSGDADFQKKELENTYGWESNKMWFQQSPLEKKEFITKLQSKNHKVVMIGDGLNDAGALQKSDAGIVITENLNNFTPSSDVVIEADTFKYLPQLFDLLYDVRKILYLLYAMALVYNGIGIFFAVQGLLSPVVAAILMPTSSISMVVTGYLLTRWVFHRHVRGWNVTSLSTAETPEKYSLA